MNRQHFRRLLLLVGWLGVLVGQLGGQSVEPRVVVSGTLYLKDWKKLASAPVVVVDHRDCSARTTETDAEGAYAIAVPKTGKYTIVISAPGFEPAYSQVELPGKGSQFRYHFLRAPTKAQTTRTVCPETVRSGGGGRVQMARIIDSPKPIYPKALRGQGPTGRVQLEGLLNESGRFHYLRVLSSPHPDFSISAIGAVSQWRYAPVLLDGVPVEVTTIVDVNYMP